ncbi:hypothetical protein Csa_016534 [Cucumis sativus]|nr:hypothetical protein Csa_016534 [Cucumis sativus]
MSLEESKRASPKKTIKKDVIKPIKVKSKVGTSRSEGGQPGGEGSEVPHELASPEK